MNKGEKRKGRRLSKDEHELWHGVTRSIAPLRRRAAKIEPGLEQPDDAKAAARPAAKISVIAPAPAKPKSAPPLAPIERRMKQRILRGRQDIDARLDLHGCTQEEAHGALRRFLRASQTKGATVVLVITGKGGRDGAGRDRGVLKRQVPMWLMLPELRDYVVGFDEAGTSHGGTGALYVRLRKKRS